MPDVPQAPPINEGFNSAGILALGFTPDLLYSVSAGAALIIPTGRRYTGARIVVASESVIRFRAEATGNIVTAQMWMPLNPSATSAIFNLRINSVAQFVGAARLIVAQNQSGAAKTGLSIAVTLGDLVELSAEQVPASGIGTPVEFLIRTEVG